jgi:hypothetical protein
MVISRKKYSTVLQVSFSSRLSGTNFSPQVGIFMLKFMFNFMFIN